MRHYAEAYTVSGARWGWQCLTPGCGMETPPDAPLAVAEMGVRAHERATA